WKTAGPNRGSRTLWKGRDVRRGLGMPRVEFRLEGTRTMLKSIRLGAAGVAIAATLGMTSAAHAVTAQATATAEILEALDVVAVSALDFGVIAANGAGTVAVATNSGVTCGANLICT